jgi:hypothetical protein
MQFHTSKLSEYSNQTLYRIKNIIDAEDYLRNDKFRVNFYQTQKIKAEDLCKQDFPPRVIHGDPEKTFQDYLLKEKPEGLDLVNGLSALTHDEINVLADYILKEKIRRSNLESALSTLESSYKNLDREKSYIPQPKKDDSQKDEQALAFINCMFYSVISKFLDPAGVDEEKVVQLTQYYTNLIAESLKEGITPEENDHAKLLLKLVSTWMATKQ